MPIEKCLSIGEFNGKKGEWGKWPRKTRENCFLATVLPQTTSRTSACADLDTRGSGLLRGLLGVDDAFLDFASEAVEGFLDIDVALGRDFHERNAELVGEGLALFRRDGAFLFPIAFVTNQNLVDAFAGVLLNVGEPCANVCKFPLLLVLPCRSNCYIESTK